MKPIVISILSLVLFSSCVFSGKSIPDQALSKFWFEIPNHSTEPGYRLWERGKNGKWTETYPSGLQSEFMEDGRTIVDSLSGTSVVKVSGDEKTTKTEDGKFGVFIPDYQKTDTFPYFRKLREDGWEDWWKSGLVITPVLTGDGSIVGEMPSTK
ncbi:MAG: hypothetical protein ACKVKH_17850 [Verrucomicrobiales bacterium]|jgi:hypothetical protein